MIGRACGLLVDLPVSLDAGVWRLSDTPGADGRRARTTLRDDLDMLQEQAHEWTGRFKVQVAGPWTLAASLFRPLGGRVLADRGARRDLAQSLAQGTSDLIAEVRTKLPQAEVVLQVDEPALPVVLAGAVPTEGGFFRHRSIDRPEAAEALGLLAALTPGAVLHCCASGVSAQLVGQSGFGALSVDRDQVDDWEGVAGFVDGGGALYLGCLPTATERAWSVDQLVGRALEVLRPLELGAALADTLMLSPGFVLDIAGILLILPFTRPVARRLLTTVVERRLVVGPAFGTPFGRPGPGFGTGFGPDDDDRPGPGPGGPVVRGDVVE